MIAIEVIDYFVKELTPVLLDLLKLVIVYPFTFFAENFYLFYINLFVCLIFSRKEKRKEIIESITNIFKQQLELFLIIIKFKPDLIQSVALKPILYTSIISKVFRKQKMIFCVVGLGYVFISKKISSKILIPFGLAERIPFTFSKTKKSNIL